jgi:hypothetical protein
MGDAQGVSVSPQAASAADVGAAKSFWPRWVLLTAVGYASGMGLSEVLYSITGAELGGILAGVLNVALYGAIVGAASGTFQSFLLRERIPRSYLWMVASAAGGAAGFVLGTLGAEAAGKILGGGLPGSAMEVLDQLVFGALCGAAIGGAQWTLLRERADVARRWVAANIAGLMVGSIIPGALWLIVRAPVRALLGMTPGALAPEATRLTNLPFLAVWLGAGGGLLLGLIQWLFARQLARSSAGPRGHGAGELR